MQIKSVGERKNISWRCRRLAGLRYEPKMTANLSHVCNVEVRGPMTNRCIPSWRATWIAVGVFCALIFAFSNKASAERPSWELKIEQVTFGTKHHFFGYIGQCQSIPWNGGNRYILGLEIENI